MAKKKTGHKKVVARNHYDHLAQRGPLGSEESRFLGQGKKVPRARITTAAEVRAESKRRKRALPSQVKLLRAELAADIAKLRDKYGTLIRNARERTTVAAVKRAASWGGAWKG